MKPIFKWTGGKRREIKHFEKYFPSFIQNEFNYVEPFVGAGAVYFHLNNVSGFNIISDFDELLINFYKQIAIQNETVMLELKRISQITDHNELESVYYYYRNMDKNDGLNKIDNTTKAIRFFVVNQLAFSGMRRFNAQNEFNVPFGHYKHLNTEYLTDKNIISLLTKTTIRSCDFESIIIDSDCSNTFIFLDPPYTRVFNKYSSDNVFTREDHIRLFKVFAQLAKASVMLIINEDEFTTELYKQYIVSSYPVKYGVNIKNRFDQNVKHLIICNYDNFCARKD